MTIARLWIRTPLAFLLTLPTVRAGTGALERLLEPLEYLDLSATYDRYSAIVDLFIYALIFVGIAHVTLGRRYPGRGGKAVCAGVGLALAVGMVIVEERYDFSLRTFGPLAACVLVLLFGIMIYETLHYAGLSRLHAVGLAYIVMFIILLGVAPESLTWLGNASPLFVLLVLGLLLAAGASVLSALAPSHYGRRAFDIGFRRAIANDPLRKWDRNMEDKEKRFIKHKLRPAAKKAYKESKVIRHDLDSIEDRIRRDGKTPARIPEIIKDVQAAVPDVEKLKTMVGNLRTLHEKVKNVDTTLCVHKNRERHTEVSAEARALLDKEMRDELQRLNLERKATQIEETMQHHVAQMTYHLTEALTALQAGQTERALTAIHAAKSNQDAIAELARLIRKLEEYLLALTRSDIRIERKMNTA